MKLFVLVVIINAVQATRNFSWWNDEGALRPGPNVCAVEINLDINYAYYTGNRYWNPRDICGKQTSIRYECCAGYFKVPGHPGCVGVKPLIDVIETIRRVGSTKFAKLLEKSSFMEELRLGTPLTLFVPSDEVFDNYLKIKGIRGELLHDGNRYLNLIANHIVDRRVLSHQWEANFLIPSRLQGNILRINKFSSGIETVNCHRIVRKDQIATNGVVHVIDGVLDLALPQNSDIIELAARDGRFGIFTSALESSELGNRIRFSETPCTIFAPTDEAFRNIPKRQLKDLLENPVALNALIAHHIVTYPVCVPNIISEYRVDTMQRQKLVLNCGSHGPTVEQASLNEEMYHGKNGLLYVLDRVLLPDRAKTVLELAKEEGLFTFLEIIRTARLEETLTHSKHYTMFAPSEAALYSLPNRRLVELKRNQESAREFVFNHVVKGIYFTDEIGSNQVASTLEIGIPLRFQVYRDHFGIENALILKADREGSNGVLHVISHCLNPDEESLEYILKSNGNFSIWLGAMERIKETQPQIYHQFKRANSSCTYFVPSDDAFRRLGDAKLRRLLDDNNYLCKTLKNHIVDGMIISESIKPDLQYTVKTKESTVNVVRKGDEVLVNDATLVKCDILNSGGIAHQINAVLLPNQCSSRAYKRTRDGIVRRVCS